MFMNRFTLLPRKKDKVILKDNIAKDEYHFTKNNILAIAVRMYRLTNRLWNYGKKQKKFAELMNEENTSLQNRLDRAIIEQGYLLEAITSTKNSYELKATQQNLNSMEVNDIISKLQVFDDIERQLELIKIREGEL